jgi:hypothetical protein
MTWSSDWRLGSVHPGSPYDLEGDPKGHVNQ